MEVASSWDVATISPGGITSSISVLTVVKVAKSEGLTSVLAVGEIGRSEVFTSPEGLMSSVSVLTGGVA